MNERGCVVAGPGAEEGRGVDLHEIVQGLNARGIQAPVLLRFADILDDRLRVLHEAFAGAIQENDYKGGYQSVYPVKVNQQHEVIAEIIEFGKRFGSGLEVGSKPELLAVLALTIGEPDQLIICNGFKDRQYLETVVLASKLGRRIIPVIENLSELDLLLDLAEQHDASVSIGVRVKLASSGSGRWGASAGDSSKFGLATDELLRMLTTLRDRGALDQLKLLHCHAGSQMQDVRSLKQIIAEISHVYVEISRHGATLDYLDVGGGLGVDYTGARAVSDSSMNYSLEEFASHVIYRVGAVCDAEGIDHPVIVTECGRAMTAYSSVLIFNVLGTNGPGAIAARANPESVRAYVESSGEPAPQPMVDLLAAFESAVDGNLVECYHDAQEAREVSLHLYSLGYLRLEARAICDQLYWATCMILEERRQSLGDDAPEALADLPDLLRDTYFCNLSIFQSLPDCWAVDQLFPVMPIHRLDEAPTVRAALADVTCDSDGKLDRFIGDLAVERSLPLHQLREGETYYIGVFLVGAYQETLGDLHNLFGDAHAAHIRIRGGRWYIEDLVEGDTISEVLTYTQHDPAVFARSMKKDCERAVQDERLTVQEARNLYRFYDEGLRGYTYLDAGDAP